MPAEPQPNIDNRRQLFVDGLVAVDYFPSLDKSQREGLVGYLNRKHISMGYLTLQLTLPEVVGQIENGSNPVLFERASYEATLQEVAGAVSIAASFLDRFVWAPFRTKEVWAKNNETPLQVERRYRRKHYKLEDSEVFKKWLESQQIT